MLFSEFYKSKDQKYYRDWTYETVFVYILGFIFYGVSSAETDLHNKYMIKKYNFSAYLEISESASRHQHRHSNINIVFYII